MLTIQRTKSLGNLQRCQEGVGRALARRDDQDLGGRAGQGLWVIILSVSFRSFDWMELMRLPSGMKSSTPHMRAYWHLGVLLGRRSRSTRRARWLNAWKLANMRTGPLGRVISDVPFVWKMWAFSFSPFERWTHDVTSISLWMTSSSSTTALIGCINRA